MQHMQSGPATPTVAWSDSLPDAQPQSPPDSPTLRSWGSPAPLDGCLYVQAAAFVHPTPPKLQLAAAAPLLTPPKPSRAPLPAGLDRAASGLTDAAESPFALAAELKTAVRAAGQPPPGPAVQRPAAPAAQPPAAPAMRTDDADEADEAEEDMDTDDVHRKLAHALYMQFYRSLRHKGCPVEIKEKYASLKGSRGLVVLLLFLMACVCNPHEKPLHYTCINIQGHRMTNMLFEEWLQSSKQWGDSRLLASLRISSTQRRSGSVKWLTRSQLLQKYGDETVVTELVNRKKQSNDTRRHPDLPERDDLVLFRVWDSYDETDSQERCSGTTLELESAADKAMVEEFMKGGAFQAELAKGVGMDAGRPGKPHPAPKPKVVLSDAEAQAKKLNQLLRLMSNDLVEADSWPKKSESIPDNMRQQVLKDIAKAAEHIKETRDALQLFNSSGNAGSSAAVEPIKDAESARELLRKAVQMARKLMPKTKRGEQKADQKAEPKAGES